MWLKTCYVVTCSYRDDHLLPIQVDVFKPSNETSWDKACLMKLLVWHLQITAVSVGMSVSKYWGWNPKTQQIHSQHGVPQVGAGVPCTGRDNQPFRPFLYSTVLHEYWRWNFFLHIYSSNHVNPSSFSQTKHAQSTVSFFFFCLMDINTTIFAEKVQVGFTLLLGPTTKTCRCFLYLCGYFFQTASVEMHLASCLK